MPPLKTYIFVLIQDIGTLSITILAYREEQAKIILSKTVKDFNDFKLKEQI